MNDMELLELAAKAAGIHGEWSERGQCIVISEVGMSWKHWRPLEDDGDALRLAVNLRLTISCDRYDDDDYMVATPPHTHHGYDCLVDQDPHAATRRAITRAAAEIGRAME